MCSTFSPLRSHSSDLARIGRFGSPVHAKLRLMLWQAVLETLFKSGGAALSRLCGPNGWMAEIGPGVAGGGERG
jgi:hypothetical protein